jgi:hypothetical protein
MLFSFSLSSRYVEFTHIEARDTVAGDEVRIMEATNKLFFIFLYS